MTETIIVIALAVYSILTVWHQSSIFEAERARVQAYVGKETWAEMLMCPVCLGFWLVIIVSLMYLYVSGFIVQMLAAYGLFQLLNNQWSVK